MKDLERQQGVSNEQVVLVGVQLAGHPHEDEPLEELTGLAESAGADVVGLLTQNRSKPDPYSYLGRGKLEQLTHMVSGTEADVVVFDNDLSPAQTRNLEEATGVKVLDRTELILDIFASRAQTHESHLAVELAQLEYSLPRLKRMWTHLSRMKMGVGMRGPGEKQLETDRRLVEKRIADLRQELDKIHQRREREVAARSDRMTVSLVGYTNAGKSTLLNALTDSRVVARDQLFATLDTRTRRWQLPGWGPVLLSDTVGFIRNLPHKLIASFKATLEEARQANLLLHVADASNPAVFDQIHAVYDVLSELGIEQKNTLLVLNKADRVAEAHQLHLLEERYPGAIRISAATGEGLGRLAMAVSDTLSEHFLEVDVQFDISDGGTLAYLSRHAEVISRAYSNEQATVHCRIPRSRLRPLEREGVAVRPHDGRGDPSIRPIASPPTPTPATEDASIDEVA